MPVVLESFSVFTILGYITDLRALRVLDNSKLRQLLSQKLSVLLQNYHEYA